MTIIVEDGSNVPNANSYLSLANIRTYASARGVTLSPVDATLEPLVIKAMDYIESKREYYQGMKTYPTQSLQFPRSEILYSDYYTGNVADTIGIMIECVRIDNDVIPQILKDILCQVTMAINAGVDFANYGQSQQSIIKEKVGPLEVQYENGGYIVGQPEIDSIDEMFDVLFYPCGNNDSFLRTVRV